MSGLLSIHPRTLAQAWIPLESSRLTFGTSTSTDLCFHCVGLEPLHGEFARSDDGDWQIEEYLPGRLTVNGLHCIHRIMLTDGDVIALSSDDSPQWVFCNAPPYRDARRERAVMNGSHADWLVYGDELFLRGDRLGQLILEGADRLGGELPPVFEAPVGAGVVDFTWCYGIWQSMVIHSRAKSMWTRWLSLALALPQGRFLRRLAIDARRMGTWRARELIDLTLLAPLPESLEHLEFGTLGEPAVSGAEVGHRLERWDRRSLRHWSV